ncbi:MAG: pyruvate ferredoxin oxidoreductase subunit gamma [Desulfonauticus sp.]|nr:pyruvate ferredoxin oxidoreductase subunit gamma [Desulfonauticus sp.]
MLEIRLHGRGGQGGVTSAELLAKAVIEHGKFAQAFPSFGPERRGAPVEAFVRISDERIRIREKIYEPNVVMVLDPTLLGVVEVDKGLHKDGVVVLNAPVSAETIKKQYNFPKVVQVDALKIALECLGVPITNTTMLGALLKAIEFLKPEDMEGVLLERFGPKLGPKNFKALQEAYHHVSVA